MMHHLSNKRRPQPITVAIIQQTCQVNKTANLQHTKAKIEAAKRQGAQLVLLQELHSTRYFCQTENTEYFDLAETIPGPTSRFLSECATKNELVIVGSLFEKRQTGVYHNTATVFDTDGSLKGIYRKMHIPDDPGFYEKFYFTPGDHDHIAFSPIQTSLGKLGVLICWDQWYPEAARLMALAGADLLLYPTAIGWDNNDAPHEQQRQLDAWVTIQRSHAIANHIPLLSANRVGHEHDPSNHTSGITFWGNSFICGPQGELLAQANNTKETLLMATIDLSRTESLRQMWPFYRDRRIDAYHDLNKRIIEARIDIPITNTT
jgi:N-carbamoylputrescine amidase